ncbi:hypothetical protein DPMN_107697 [Dreissena polymorpha]|uniref:Uncharacterized protein n=1 Tax=Dreissena polymorpha TaxID=45954 RepID=A0A9D4QKF2_DREPO|nr:hypothetical protein DPMN_107697 [Dreissena polymorpha]
MPPELFDEILERISQVISRQDTKYRSSLTPGLKLALTLRIWWKASTFRLFLHLNVVCSAGGSLCSALSWWYVCSSSVQTEMKVP